MMRILDRYLLGTFVASLAVFTGALVVLFVTVDVTAKLGKFLALDGFLGFLLEYYALRLPMILTYLLPAVVLFAAMFTIIRLSRTNEILPVAAAGTSLRRLAAPFLVCAVLASWAMIAIDEYALPRVGKRIEETDHVLESEGSDWLVYDWDGWTKIWTTEYNPRTQQMLRRVRLTVSDGNARHVLVVDAARGEWSRKHQRWVLYEGTILWPRITRTGPNGKPVLAEQPIGPEGYVVRAPFRPETLRRTTTLWSKLASSPLRTLLAEARRRPHDPKPMIRLHMRLAFPVSPLVLLLLGLPFVLSAQAHSFIRGLFFCFLLSVGFYLVFFAFLELGNRGMLPAGVAGWGPTGGFGAAGLLAFSRMRT